MSNIAAIDVGSNAIRMTVARQTAAGALETLENLRLPVRLGQDAFTSGKFGEQSIQMAVDAFLRFRQVADLYQASEVRAVATSAMRESANRDELIARIAAETGIKIELIDGLEEARLIHLAVTKSIRLAGKKALLIDIGGGSIEVVLSDGEHILSTESFNLGTVRLLRKLETDNQSQPFSQLMTEYVDSAQRHIRREIGSERVDVCLGTGGNVEELGKLRRRIFKRERDDVISLAELQQITHRLAKMRVEERIAKYDLRPDRADVILPAAAVLSMVMREARVQQLIIPGVGLKDGVLWEMIPFALGPRIPRREQALASAGQMGKKYAYDGAHALLIARFAVTLFDQSDVLHRLGENERLLVEIAALLHDIGHFINSYEHEKHGFYLLQNHPLIGLMADEQNIVANIVRYHRKQGPSLADIHFKSLSPKERQTVLQLCALLRLADGLDTSHTTRVQNAALRQLDSETWQLSIQGPGELMLEKWDLEKRKALFQDVFNVRLEIA